MSLFSITFDPNVENNQKTTNGTEREVEQCNGEGNPGGIISKIKSVLHLSVWKEPSVVALFLSEAHMAFGHFVPLIHLVRATKEYTFL